MWDLSVSTFVMCDDFSFSLSKQSPLSLTFCDHDFIWTIFLKTLSHHHINEIFPAPHKGVFGHVLLFSETLLSGLSLGVSPWVRCGQELDK